MLLADQHVWRATSFRGHVEIVDLGLRSTLQKALDSLSIRPSQAEEAGALGATLLGKAAFRSTDETLFVFLDRPLSRIPVAALAVEGRPIVALRPLVRVSRLSNIGCVFGAMPPPRAAVIADANGTLPAARRDAEQIAGALHATSAVGVAATSEALFALEGDDLLHIAVSESDGSLKLYDRTVSPFEISRRLASPPLVFLASCATAVFAGSGLAPSLVDGFLAAGSSQVIGTVRPVSDSGASRLTQAFYALDGTRDPVRALARVQAELANTSDVDWPNFAVFGSDTCRGGGP